MCLGIPTTPTPKFSGGGMGQPRIESGGDAAVLPSQNPSERKAAEGMRLTGIEL